MIEICVMPVSFFIVHSMTLCKSKQLPSTAGSCNRVRKLRAHDSAPATGGRLEKMGASGGTGLGYVGTIYDSYDQLKREPKPNESIHRNQVRLKRAETRKRNIETKKH